MGMEFELKYACNPQQQNLIWEAIGGFAEIAMETTYFDTPDGAFSARHITLRHRKENGIGICTVKTPEKDHCRGEWEVACDRIMDAIPMLCKLGCSVDLLSLTAPGIMPVCGARFTRLAKTLDLGPCVIELALDSGILFGGGNELAFSEVEVEFKSGDRNAAILYARQIAALYGLSPEKHSKFRRALALAKGE